MRPFVICFFVVFSVHGNIVAAQTGQLVWTEQEMVKQSYRPLIKSIRDCGFFGCSILWYLAPKKRIYISPNFYVENMGAVCKVELGIQKHIKFPLFIRLGSKDYADKMEGKFLQRR